MEMSGDNYRIVYDPTSTTIICPGALRHCGDAEYQSMMELLSEAANQAPETITLQLQELEFLDSAGISALFKFVIKIRSMKKSRLIVQGNRQIPWQNKALKNIQRLMPEMILDWYDATKVTT